MTQIEGETDRILSEGVVLAGRRFRALGVTTFEHDAYTMQALADAKLLSPLERFDPVRQELDDLTSAIIVECFRSGKLFDLLGAVLAEDGKPWTPTAAANAARFFASLTDPTDKETLTAIVPWVLLRFFLRAGASLSISLSSGISSGPRPRDASAPANDDNAPPIDAGRSAGPSTMASGTSSFERSQGSTPADMATSPAGPSERG
jgi:hypothetical protein